METAMFPIKLSTMSGDSPSALAGDGFDFIDDRSSPAPTSSKDTAVQNTGVVTASVLVESHKKDDKDRDDIALLSPIANSSPDEEGRRNSEADKTLKIGDCDGGGEKRGGDENDGSKKPNGVDRLDAVFIPSRDQKPAYEYDPRDDGCCMKCLSFTMECCECSIM